MLSVTHVSGLCVTHVYNLSVTYVRLHKVFTFGGGYTAENTLKLRLPDGVLVPGENSIELRNVYEGGGSTVKYDYIRLRAVSPEANFCVTFK